MKLYCTGYVTLQTVKYLHLTEFLPLPLIPSLYCIASMRQRPRKICIHAHTHVTIHRDVYGFTLTDLIALQTGCVLVYAHQLLLTQKNPKTSHAAQLYRSRSTAHQDYSVSCKCHIACFWLSLPFAVLLVFFFLVFFFKRVKNPCSHLFGHSCGFTFMNYIS